MNSCHCTSICVVSVFRGKYSPYHRLALICSSSLPYQENVTDNNHPGSIWEHTHTYKNISMEYSDSALRKGGYWKYSPCALLLHCSRSERVKGFALCGYYSQPVSCYWERPIKEAKQKKNERTDEEAWRGWIKSCLICDGLYPFRKSQYKNGLHKKHLHEYSIPLWKMQCLCVASVFSGEKFPQHTLNQD